MGHTQTALQQAVQAAGGRSSRRKPAAPQWVRPEWMEDKKEGDISKTENTNDAKENDSNVGGKENSMTINGVCVMNSYAFENKKTSDTTEEDTNIMDHANDEDARSTKLSEDNIQRSPSVSPPPIALNSNPNNAISVTENIEGNS
jgi:homeobox protein cut-like